ncbi:MAG: V-type ATP synthase subunit C [Peptococcaceae bacterium]|nr:V-type ATP synthase subunit C [Peptococcaceae bacterium]
MSISQDSRYAYAVGRIRVLENKLLDKTKMQRLQNAKSVDEALLVLSETDYADLVAKAPNPYDIDAITTEEIKRVYLLIRELLPKEALADLFLIKYDIHNLKVLLKAHYQKKDFDYLLVDAGLVPAETIKSVLKNDQLPSIPKEYYEGVKAAKAAYEERQDPKVIDEVLDRTQTAMVADMASKGGHEFYRRLLAAQVDLVNLKSLARVKRLGRGRAFLDDSLLPGGTLAPSFFTPLYGSDWAQLVQAFSLTPYKAVVEQGVAAYLESGQLTTLEKLADNFQMTMLREAKMFALGPEPIIAYVMAKENEVRNIRIIMIGKKNGVATAEIAERLRESYV